ncbi:MAG: hypothetical protein Q8R79_06060 [Legionellaceae bacterium]|nr:hypothetical protein [Legionellaceae bacterium]
MKILIITAPFEAENTGDITYARQIERCSLILGHETAYLRAQDLGLTAEVSKSLDTSICVREVQDALKKIGDSLKGHIVEHISKDAVLFMHFRVPHTGFSFSAEHLSQLKSAGYKICALIHEHSSNREEPVDIERNYQTAKLIPFFDQIIMFNPTDRDGLLETADTRNFYHCTTQQASLATNVWTLFHVDNKYPLRVSLKDRVSLIPVPILSAAKYEVGPADRPPHVLMFGTIRRNKGNTSTLNLAQLLVARNIPDMQIKIVGRVFADMNGFSAFQQYISQTYPESLGFVANFKPLRLLLKERKHLVGQGQSLDDYETQFNSLCKEIVRALESQVTDVRHKALPIELHVDVNDDEFKTLCHQSRYGIKFDKKGFCNNASSIINMMGLGLIVISNRTYMTDQTTFGNHSELPLVLLDQAEPEAELLFQIISQLNQDATMREQILRNLERVMTTFFDPMHVTGQVTEVLEKTLAREALNRNVDTVGVVSNPAPST